MYGKIAILSTAAILTATSSFAATSATATTDLNLRANPGPLGEIIGVIPGDGEVQVEQCATEIDWCKVSFGGQEGWAYSPYLTASLDTKPVILRDNIQRLQVETVDVNEDQRADAATAGALTGGAIAMSLIGGPAAVAAGVLLGTAAGASAVPEESVTYVEAHPVQPVYMNGEVIVGAGIPEGAQLVAIPDSDYRYINVNGQPVLVDTDRTIVKIVR